MINNNIKTEECVKVVIRCRPLSTKENSDGRKRIVNMDDRTRQVLLQNPKPRDSNEAHPRTFTFDSV